MRRYPDLKEMLELLVAAELGAEVDIRALVTEMLRQRRALEAMAAWLVSCQAGFGQRDMEGINEILRGEK